MWINHTSLCVLARTVCVLVLSSIMYNYDVLGVHTVQAFSNCRAATLTVSHVGYMGTDFKNRVQHRTYIIPH